MSDVSEISGILDEIKIIVDGFSLASRRQMPGKSLPVPISYNKTTVYR